MRFVNGLLTPGGGTGDPNTKGLYWHDDKRIELAVSPKWSNGEISTTTAHEFGHFLYFQTYMFWTEEEKAQLAAEYDYWKQYSYDCKDIEETFATLYSMYRESGGQYLSDACKAMLDGAEQDCAWLLERKTKGDSSWEFGPGMKMPAQESAADEAATDGAAVEEAAVDGAAASGAE